MAIEDPVRLLRRLRLGREEYCQRLLTMLILGGPYPPWNTPNAPSGRGTRFLRELDALSFGTDAGTPGRCSSMSSTSPGDTTRNKAEPPTTPCSGPNAYG